MISLFSLLISFSFSALLKPVTVLDRWTNNNGSGSYQIELDITFSTAQETINFKEVWSIEDDQHMKLKVLGNRGQVWQFSYENNQRLQNTPNGKSSKRISDEFIEKYFHIRKPEDATKILNKLALLSPHFASKKAVDDPMFRLTRISGTVAYAFGTATPVDAVDAKPGLWIEQDQFVLRKFRTASNVELVADQHSAYSRGLHYPKSRTLHWGDQTVAIQTLSITPLSAKAVGQISLEQTPVFEISDEYKSKFLIEEFYKRFR